MRRHRVHRVGQIVGIGAEHLRLHQQEPGAPGAGEIPIVEINRATFAQCVRKLAYSSLKQRRHFGLHAHGSQVGQKTAAQLAWLPIRKIQRHPSPARARIVGVVAREYLQQHGQVRHAARKNAHAIQPPRRRHQPACGNLPVRRLERIHAAIAGRDADRTQAVRPDGCRRQPSRHRGRRAAGGTTRGVTVFPRVVGRAEMRVVGGSTKRAFVHVGLADQDGTRSAQPRDHVRIARHRLFAARHAGARRPAGNVDVVLDRQRYAVEPTDHAIAATVLGGARLLLHQAETQPHIRVEARVDPFDRLLIRIGQCLRFGAPGGQPVQQLVNAGAAQVEIGDRRRRIHEALLPRHAPIITARSELGASPRRVDGGNAKRNTHCPTAPESAQ